jgi:glutaredoxin-related protein
MIDFK